jgi:hypothetical protein
MPTSQARVSDSGVILLFTRLWDEARMTSTVARHIQKLGFTEADKARMSELLEKNRESAISSVELRELDDYVSVADLLSLLHLKARIFLKNRAKLKTRRT